MRGVQTNTLNHICFSVEATPVTHVLTRSSALRLLDFALLRILECSYRIETPATDLGPRIPIEIALLAIQTPTLQPVLFLHAALPPVYEGGISTFAGSSCRLRLRREAQLHTLPRAQSSPRMHPN